MAATSKSALNWATTCADACSWLPRSGGRVKKGMRPPFQSWSTHLAAATVSGTPPRFSLPRARATWRRKSWASVYRGMAYSACRVDAFARFRISSTGNTGSSTFSTAMAFRSAAAAADEPLVVVTNTLPGESSRVTWRSSFTS